MQNRDELETLDPRRAGQVSRYHTWPHIRETSVAEHSWQVMRILLAIRPDAPRHMLIHCMTHDIGEVKSGDPPYPVKRENDDLKRACERVERDAHLKMCLPWATPGPIQLTDEERVVFKLSEMIEMWEWGLHELELGNKCAGLVVQRCSGAAAQMIGDMPEETRTAARRYMRTRVAAHDSICSRVETT